MTHWYFLQLDGRQQPERTTLTGLLCRAQRERVLRLTNEDARCRSLCAHLLARVLVCEAAGLANTRLRIEPGANGKPRVIGVSGVELSLSHTRGAVAAAVAATAVGVDIERLREADLKIARRFFTPAEAAYIGERPGEANRRFFEVWTRKEACVKMRGARLAVSLASLDTRAPEWTRRLVTAEAGEYLVSCCCDAPPPGGPVFLTERELLERASLLAPCEV